jgi:hypothetical protein
VREGLAAPLFVLREWRMFLQISLPWALFLGLGLYLLAAFADTIGRDANAATMLLLLLLILLVGVYVIVPTVAVAWFRFTIQGRQPERYVALPDRAALGLAWRLWLSLSVLGSCDGLVTTQATALAARIPALDAPSVGDTTGWVFDILALMLASSFALRLPARAVSDPDFSQTVALAAGGRMWPGLPVGLILSLAPVFVLGWVADQLVGYLANPTPHAHGPDIRLGPVATGCLGLGSLVVFAAVASGASYLSRAYLAAKIATRP